jgi:hypothetical protein
MALYFMLHDAERFHSLLSPSLAASWRHRSLAPCRTLCSALTEDFERFVTENRVRREEMMMLSLQPNMLFNRDVWRIITGEVLLAAAAEVPEIPDVEETLIRLLGDDPSIHQAIHGTRGLRFGGGWYRPDHAGYNDASDVKQLAGYLTSIDLGSYPGNMLTGHSRANEEEWKAELGFALHAIKLLATVYDQARSRGQLIICEAIV